ncbi:MAG: homoserine dehydrogenase, partial [Clostridium sp.]|nr:homoserine dehydrogenase [Clostridium sp.]
IFGSNRVSLKSVIQKGRKHDESHEVDLVLITHKTKEALINDSIEKLYDLRTVKDIENIIRIEDFI